MQLKLINLELKSFKGIDYFKLETGGDSATIKGQNAVGKTTLADAFFWLLTDESGDGSSSFEILKNGQRGSPRPNAVVAGTFQIQSKTIVLKKEYCEKWTKKRGSASAGFTGNRTDHFFDSVPVSKKIFGQKLAEIIDPKLIRTLSDVHFFCGRSKLEYRREMLMMLAGDISDADIIAGDKSLMELPFILDDKSVDDAKAILTQAKRACNRQLDQIPARIDEKKRDLPTVVRCDEIGIRDNLMGTKDKIAINKNKIAAIENSDGQAEKLKEIALLDAQLIRTENDIKHAAQHDREVLAFDLSSKKIELDTARLTLLQLKADLSKNQTLQDTAIAEKQELVVIWQKKDASKFIQSKTCIICGQLLPEGYETDQEKIFNLEKAKTIKYLDNQGNALAKRIIEFEEEKITLDDKIILLASNILNQDLKLKQAEQDLHDFNNQLQAKIGANTNDILTKIADLTTKKIDLNPAKKALEQEVIAWEQEKEKLEKDLADILNVEKALDRIRQLDAELKDAAIEFELIESKLFMLEQFIIKRAEYIQTNVSDHFEITKWNLFRYQVNEGVRPICEATRDGVNYSLDLNTGSKINVGLDCIKAFSRHFGVSVPVFVDNAESVTAWIDTAGMQLIKLVASNDFDTLEVVK